MRNNQSQCQVPEYGPDGSLMHCAYGLSTAAESRPGLSPAALASLRGLAASGLTFVLWIVVMMLATPTPGLATSIESAPNAVVACAIVPEVA